MDSRIEMSEIADYTIQLPTRRFASIKFNLKSGKSLEYSFQSEKLSDDQVDADKLLEEFHSAIKNYNQTSSNSEKILFRPSFLASGAGVVCIVTLFLLAVVAIVINAVYSVKTVPISIFFAAMLIIQLLIRRSSDIALYKKMK